MPALTTPRQTPEREGAYSNPPVKGTTTLFQGGLVVSEAGFAVPGKTGANLTALGIATTTVVNSGADGAVRAPIKRGTFAFHNHDADAVTVSDIGKDCFVVDDQTVAKTNGTNTRSRAGTVIDVDGGAVWVRVGY